MKNYIKLIFTSLVILSFTSCNIDNTKETIVFEENIGIPKSWLGRYKPDLNRINREYDNDYDIKFNDFIYIIYYDLSKYRLFEYIDAKVKDKKSNENFNLLSYKECIFLPSKVNGTEDFYIMSYSYCTVKSFDFKKKTYEKRTSYNDLAYAKKENNNLLVWHDFLNDDEEKKNASSIKNIIKTKYKKTFIKEPSSIYIKVNNVPKNIISIKNKIIEEVDKKYKNYRSSKL